MIHEYLSTGCLHGEHDYWSSMTGMAGAKRPAQCKWCEAPCRCRCHTNGLDAAETASASDPHAEGSGAVSVDDRAREPVSAADTLRRAAALIEQQAKQATPGPWEIEYAYGNPRRAQALFVGCHGVEPCGTPGECYDGTCGIGGFDRPDDNVWSALMHPGIAVPLAAWLRHEAAVAEVYERDGAYNAAHPALALAAALLGAVSL